KVVQETAAHLGELDGEGRVRARQLAQAITGRGDQRELFEEAPAAEHAVAVRLDRVRLERARAFGDVWLGWTLWQALRLDELCSALLPRGREAIPWAQMAAVLVIARLCEPSSELHIAEDWYRTTALEDLLGIAAERIEDHRLYRALDRLLPHKAALEQHLRQRLGELFALEYDLLLYDVTSTYFEGLALRNALAARGYSRDHRPDCKQVCIALVVTRGGIPLGYGNIPRCGGPIRPIPRGPTTGAPARPAACGRRRGRSCSGRRPGCCARAADRSGAPACRGPRACERARGAPRASAGPSRFAARSARA